MKIKKQIKSVSMLLGLVVIGGTLLLSACSEGDTKTNTTEETRSTQVSDESSQQLYTCPMHTDYISEEPGECPECGMDLVPVEEVEGFDEHSDRDSMNQMEMDGENEATVYTCPMHPEVTSNEPGECPECGMDLVPQDQVQSNAGEHEGQNHNMGEMNTEQDQHGENHAASVSGQQTEMTGNVSATADEDTQLWTCSMHPNVVQEEPGECPICGMDLVPLKRGSSGGGSGSVITVDPVVVQNMGVRTANVERRNLTREVRALGHVTYDENKLAHVHTKVDGYIEKAYVQATGTKVKAGQPLVEIYSPDLVSTQEEYLQAFRSAQQAQAGAQPAREMLESARRRLELWDISDAQINRLEQTGNVTKTMTLNSPFNGVVVFTDAIEGMYVKPGMQLYKIADLSSVWVEADIYEYELPWIEKGQPVVMNQSYTPGKEYVGRVDFIYPYMESKTRTVKVRSIIENQNGELKPGMYVNMQIQSEINDDVTTLPEESIIFSGTRAITFIALGDGRFDPRNVELGALSGDGYYQVYSGVQAGEKVVTSGQFLLDSESKLQEALQKMVAQNESGEGAGDAMPGHNH